MEPLQILDRVHLARYTLGDPALESEILGLFVGQLPETLALLRGSEDPSARKRTAHTIKGSARAVGAWKLAHTAERAEGCSGRLECWNELAAEIETAADEVCRFIMLTCLSEPALAS